MCIYFWSAMQKLDNLTHMYISKPGRGLVPEPYFFGPCVAARIQQEFPKLSSVILSN